MSDEAHILYRGIDESVIVRPDDSVGGCSVSFVTKVDVFGLLEGVLHHDTKCEKSRVLNNIGYAEVLAENKSREIMGNEK